MSINILIPLPTYGFDPTEAAIVWKLLKQNNFNVIFATKSANKPQADKIMLTGKGLGLFKSFLMARNDALQAYLQMEKSEEFRNPIRYRDIKVEDFDAVFLPGGHDKGVKEYLESKTLQSIMPLFFKQKKVIAAVCHGVILLARSKYKETNKSVIYDYNTTSLLKIQELIAYHLTKFNLKDYYLTYPETTVEDEVISVLRDKSQFKHGPLPIFKDNLKNTKYGFSVIDRRYISARWPGDIYNLSFNFINMLKKYYKDKLIYI